MPDSPDPSAAGEGVGSPVRAAVGLLEGLQDRPVAEHVAVFDAVHQALQDALATLDRA